MCPPANQFSELRSADPATLPKSCVDREQKLNSVDFNECSRVLKNNSNYMSEVDLRTSCREQAQLSFKLTCVWSLLVNLLDFVSGNSCQSSKNVGSCYKNQKHSDRKNPSSLGFSFGRVGLLFAAASLSLSAVSGNSSPTAQPTSFNPHVIISSARAYRNYATLNLQVDASAVHFVRCGAFYGSQTVSLVAIHQQNNYKADPDNNFMLNVTNLIPSMPYSVYCTAVNTDGLETSIDTVRATRKDVTTECCRDVRVTLRYHALLSEAVTSNAIVVSIDAAPADLQASIEFTSNATVSYGTTIVYPAAIVWTSASNVYNTSTPITILPAGDQFQQLVVTLSGASASIYRVVYTQSPKLVVTTVESVPSTPVPLQAIFSSDGGSVTYSFDSPTDKGAFANNFKCTELLSFDGAATAFCGWADSATIVIYPTYTAGSSVLVVGGGITVLAGKIRAQCTAIIPTNCRTWGTVVTKIVSVAPPLLPVLPSVVISSASSLDACSSMTVDLTNSVGNAGRPWASYSFQVRANGARSNVSADALQLENFLNRNYTLSPPTAIPNAAFAKGKTFAITATLCNYLQACGSNVASVAVSTSTNPVPVVTFVGGRGTRSVFRSEALSITASAVVQLCGGATSSANLKYDWSVWRVPTSGGSVNTNLKTESQNAAVLKLLPYALDIGVAYEVRLTVTTTNQASSMSSTVTVPVVLKSSPLVAVIDGGSTKYMKVNTNLVLDASKSLDPDVLGKTGAAAGLFFTWSCVQSVPTLSNICPLTFPASNTEKLEVSSIFSSLNTTSVITVTVSDGRLRTTSVQITIAVSDTTKPKLDISSNLVTLDNVNTLKSFVLYGQVQIVAPCAASWSVDDSSVKLSDISSTVISRSLLPAAGAVPFNLVINAGALPQRASLSFSLYCGDTKTSVTVSTNGAPLPGSFIVSPMTGEELSTTFSFSALQWTDPDLPLTYQFGFISETSLSNLVIVSRSMSAYSFTTLPAGLESAGQKRNCSLDVYDSLNAFRSVRTAVTVTTVTAAQKNSRLLALVQSNTGSVDSTKNIISVVSTALNSVNCTAAPNCTTINRSGCVRTSNECGPCLTGYIGEAGDRSTMCIPASSLGGASASCSKNTDCSSWQVCDIPSKTCVAPIKTCSQNCNGHGSCIYVDTKSGDDTLSSCRLTDINCNAVCFCEDKYSGEFCQMGDTDLQSVRGVRSNLISSLSNLTVIDDINAESVSGWSASLYSLSIQPYELSEDDVKVVAAIANATLHHAIALGVDNYEDMAGVLQATDTVASLQKYNYNPNDYRDESFGVKRDYENNTAAGTVNTVSSFADLVAQNMVLGQNTTAFLYDNFRMSVTLSDVTAGAVFSSPLNDAEAATGVPASTASLIPNDDAASAPAYVAVKVISVPARAYTPDSSAYVSTPLMIQVTPQGSNLDAVPSGYLSSLELTLENSALMPEYVNPTVTNFTTVCTKDLIGQDFTFKCPVSGETLTNHCPAVGEAVSFCSVPTPAAAKVNVDTADFAVLNTCDRISFTASDTTYSCSMQLDSRRKLANPSTVEDEALDKSGATCMMTSTVYIASQFADTFKAAGSFNSAEDLAKVVVVLVMMGLIWGSGVFVVLYEGYVHPQVLAVVKDPEPKKIAQLQQASVMNYVTSVIPHVFKEGGTFTERMWKEILEHHMLFKIFGAKTVMKRRELIFRTMTLFTFMMFLIVIFFDVSNPGDDGTCKVQMSDEGCQKRVSPFDSAQNFCKWNDVTGKCNFNSESMTITAMFYLTVLTTVLTAIATIPLDYFFDVMCAPTAKSLENSKVDSMVASMRAGMRRVSNVGLGAHSQPKVTPAGEVKDSGRWSIVPTFSSEKGGKVIANRSISEDIVHSGESARQAHQILMKNNQTMTLQSNMSKQTLQARSNRRLTRMQSMRPTPNKKLIHSSPVSSPISSPMKSIKEVELRDPESLTDPVTQRVKSSSSLCAELIQQRVLMNDNAVETQEFDIQWGIYKDESPDAEEVYYFAPAARTAIEDACAAAEEEAASLKVSLSNYTVHHAGLEMLHLFMVDLLGRNTSAAKIFKEKFSEEFEDSRAVELWQKYLSGAAILGLNGFFMYYVLLKAFVKGYAWQIEFLTVFLLQFAVEMLIFETTECVWLNFSVPSFVRKEVGVAIDKLRAQVDRVTLPPDQQYDEKETAIAYWVNAPSHMFASVMVAKEHTHLLESLIVGCYTHHLPGEIWRTWPQFKAYKPTLAAEDEENRPEDSIFNHRWLRPVVRGLSLSLQIFITIPYLYQKITIRFVQPMVFSGITIVWFFAIANPGAIGGMCGLLALIILFFVWRRHVAIEEAKAALLSVSPDELNNELALDFKPVPTFIDDKDDASSDSSASTESGSSRRRHHNKNKNKVSYIAGYAKVSAVDRDKESSNRSDKASHKSSDHGSSLKVVQTHSLAINTAVAEDDDRSSTDNSEDIYDMDNMSDPSDEEEE